MEGATNMSSVVTALQSILTTDAMFTNLASLLPVVGGVLIFAFPLDAPVIIFLTIL